jgi:hypothetical protein
MGRLDSNQRPTDMSFLGPSVLRSAVGGFVARDVMRVALRCRQVAVAQVDPHLREVEALHRERAERMAQVVEPNRLEPGGGERGLVALAQLVAVECSPSAQQNMRPASLVEVPPPRNGVERTPRLVIERD